MCVCVCVCRGGGGGGVGGRGVEGFENAENYNSTNTGPDDSVTMSSANGLVGTGFASRYRLQPRAGFYRPNV